MSVNEKHTTVIFGHLRLNCECHRAMTARCKKIFTYCPFTYTKIWAIIYPLLPRRSTP